MEGIHSTKPDHATEGPTLTKDTKFNRLALIRNWLISAKNFGGVEIFFWMFVSVFNSSMYNFVLLLIYKLIEPFALINIGVRPTKVIQT